MPLDAVSAFDARRVAFAVWGRALVRCCVLAVGLLGMGSLSHAQGIELPQLKASRAEGGLTLDFEVKLGLSRAVEEAMQRGVPIYFTAQAQVFRPRWYWRDQRVAQAVRTWRVSYQPLTSAWRVSLGAFSQSFATADAALAMVSRASNWRVVEAEAAENLEHCYVEFSYRLDSALLPRPMQLDLAAQSDWRLLVERALRLD
jgi:hypothetical protein